MKIKACFEGGFDHLKVGGHVKVTRRKQAVVAHAQNLVETRRAIGPVVVLQRGDRQNGVTNRLKRLRDQG